MTSNLSYLHLLVLLRQLAAELLQLVFHSNCFVELRFALLLVFLQLVRALLALSVIAIQLLHVRQQLDVFLVDGLQAGHWRLNIIEKLVQVPSRLLHLALYTFRPRLVAISSFRLKHADKQCLVRYDR